MRLRYKALMAIAAVSLLQGCFFGGNSDINRVPKVSSKTGAEYNEEGGFQVKDYAGPETAPGLVFVEGGTFIMGSGEEDIAFAMDNRERQVTVASFYMDQTEVANVDWKEFLFHVLQDSGQTKYERMLPDTMVWYRELAYNDPYVQYYFQHEGFNMYPVVGINWYQANEYCAWRTARANAIKKEDEEDDFVAYPAYRLPSEAEWEYAARGGLEQELYPWQGKSLRWTYGKLQGRFQSNIKRGRGDYAGRSNQGKSNMFEGLNDGYMITAPVGAFWPNDFGLFNMAGNVAEWTFDTYRVLSYEDVEDLNPARRRGQTEDQQTADDNYDGSTSLLYHPENPNWQSQPDIKGRRGGVNDNVKVYRGGSWADIAYYSTTGARRFYNADSSAATIGFRCAMIRVGSPMRTKSDR